MCSLLLIVKSLKVLQTESMERDMCCLICKFLAAHLLVCSENFGMGASNLNCWVFLSDGIDRYSQVESIATYHSTAVFISFQTFK